MRTLCEFTARAGDLDRRFVPAPTALQGIAGHGIVFERRPAHYEREVSLEAHFESLQTGTPGLTVRGRADGFDPERNRVEEIKTHRGDLSRMPANQRVLHWAQAKVYGHLLCISRDLPQIDVALVYFNIGTGQETVLVNTYDAQALAEFFQAQCRLYVEWAQQESSHRQRRDAALEAMTFPHGAFRAGQRVLAEGVYRGLRDGHTVLAQAPTGIGKSIGTLFPALKACATQGVDKLFFLTAKTPGRAAALDAAQCLNRAAPTPLGLRTLELVAREKACENPGRACNGEDCALASGFYDRLPRARAVATAYEGVWDAAALRAIALEHSICPYYLGQELVRWSDVVVADYNHYFDASAMLYAYTLAQQWRVGVLVDEAHNLIARARGMYSSQLDQTALDGARHLAPTHLRKPLNALHKQWQSWNKSLGNDDAVLADCVSPPDALISAIVQATTTLTELMDDGVGIEPEVMRFFFDALQFVRLAESFGPHSLFDVTLAGASTAKRRTILAIRNVVPASFLAPRYAAARSTTLFSGTLNPMHYFADMLGLPPTTHRLDVPSPFRADQLDVQIVDAISTRYADRDASIDKIANHIAAQFQRRPGNYLSFFSSFDYLKRVVSAMARLHPAITIWSQTPGMPEADRSVFLSRFQQAGQGVGFAVLGGAFGEAIDLPGTRLIGAFIATLGLPQHNVLNERIMACLGTQFGKGYDYTYLYPGLQNVVQAAGRVIRTETDTGVVHLIDDRYNRHQIRALLPVWWAPRRYKSGENPQYE